MALIHTTRCEHKAGVLEPLSPVVLASSNSIRKVSPSPPPKHQCLSIPGSCQDEDTQRGLDGPALDNLEVTGRGDIRSSQFAGLHTHCTGARDCIGGGADYYCREPGELPERRGPGTEHKEMHRLSWPEEKEVR